MGSRPRSILLRNRLPRKTLELSSPAELATTRATSTSLNLLHRVELQYQEHGALFALTASLSLTPTLSANNLGSPKPNGTMANHLLVLFKATGLVLCRLLPTPSSSEMVLLA